MTSSHSITCDEALRLLAAFLDGELSDGESDSVEGHLEMCRSCFSRAEFERRLKTEFTHLRRDDVPAGFEERVRHMIGAFSTAVPRDSSGKSQS
jgi:anti-sigma factor (TIGR02949 family)